MAKSQTFTTRRNLLRGAAYGTAGALAMPYILRRAWAQDDFPSQTMQVIIPTGQGGGVERSARAFNAVLSQVLGQEFEYSNFPGASGQVGYETFLGQREANGYNLLFGAIAPEMIMYATQDPNYTYPDDYVYFSGVVADDANIWVSEDSPFQTLEDLIEEGLSRTITFSGSRLPHPASLAVFLLAQETGADFNIVPYGGGSAARSAAVTGEVDACTTHLGSSLSLADQVRFLGIFADHNRVPGPTDNARTVNEIMGTDFPPLGSRRAYAIQRAAIEQYPERFELLKEASREAFDRPELQDTIVEAGFTPEFLDYADEELCAEHAQNILDLTERFGHLLEE